MSDQLTDIETAEDIYYAKGYAERPESMKTDSAYIEVQDDHDVLLWIYRGERWVMESTTSIKKAIQRAAEWGYEEPNVALHDTALEFDERKARAEDRKRERDKPAELACGKSPYTAIKLFYHPNTPGIKDRHGDMSYPTGPVEYDDINPFWCVDYIVPLTVVEGKGEPVPYDRMY